jgi:ribonuclease HII
MPVDESAIRTAGTTATATTTASAATIRIGLDENGLGPRLGPLIVTAVLARTSDPAGQKLAEGRPKGALRARLGDSKRLVSFGDTALGEAWARAIAARMGLDREPASPDALVHALSLDSPEELRAPCPRAPTDHAAQCWSHEGEAFVAEPKLVAKLARDLDKLEARGVDVRRVTCVVTCTRRLNAGLERGLTRFHSDLHAMERLVLDARDREGADVVATCGKVGGFARYSGAFGPLGGRLHAIAEEGRKRSEYSFPGVGRIAFVRDADEKHLLVCMASLVGKWVRDLLMARIVRYHRADNPDVTDASGYHDPVTSRFVEATRLSRKRRALPDDCFERRAWGDVER